MKKVKGLLWLALVSVMINLSSCMNQPDIEDPTKQLNADIAAIDAYLEGSIYDVVKDASGVRMEILELGTEMPAKSVSTTVDVDYVGRLFSTGTIFDQGNLKTSLSGVIDGWKIAFTTLPVGSRANLYIPSGRAYGTTARTGIPANSILVFAVEFNEAVITTTEVNQFKTDTAAIHDYLETNAIANVMDDDSGLQYVVTQLGVGQTPSWYEKLSVNFTYRLLTSPSTVAANVQNVPTSYFYSRSVDYVHGLKIGLQKLPAGSKATFYIPSGLGFGPFGANNGSTQVIPANANLIVEVELVKVEDPQ